MKLPNNLFPLLAILSLFSMTSCSDITSEIWIEKSGGGRMEISADMASFFPQELMNKFKDEVGDSLGLDEVVPKEEAGPKDEVDKLFGMMLKDGEVMDIDTTINLYSMMPDSVKEKTELAMSEEITKRITLHLNGNSEEGTAIAKFSMKFKDEDEMQEMLAGMNEAFSKREGAEMSDSDKKQSIAQFKSNYKRGIIQLPSLKVPDDLGDNMPGEMPGGLDELGGLFGGANGEQSEEDKAQMDFMKNMLGKIIVKVHAPGPIQFTNDPNAEIYGNTVIFKKSIMEFGQGPEQGRIIKFGK